MEKSRQKPQERMRVLSDVGVFHMKLTGLIYTYVSDFFMGFWQALKINNYDAEPMLRSCGVSINSNFTQVEGRVLSAPRVYHT